MNKLSDRRDRILLEELVFQCQIGALSFEQAFRQPLAIDLELFCKTLPACESDRLDETISYAEVYEVTRQVAEQSTFNLVERMAGAISARLLAEFSRVDAVEVTVRKPHAPIPGHFKAVGVCIYRERSR